MSRLVACAIAVLGIASTLVLAAPPASAAPGNEDWRGWLNQARAEAGLEPLAHNSAWSAGARKHATYAVRNQRFAHDEDPRLPYASPEGRHATRTGNLYGSTVRNTPKFAIDGWMESPGHALWMLHPNATAAGYGEFHDPYQRAGGYRFPLKWVAVLPIVDSVNWYEDPVAFTYPRAGATLERRPGTLYATYADPVRCPCTATVTVNGRAVRATASVYAPGGAYPHGHTVVIELDERLPDGAAVSVNARPANQSARAWSFGPAPAAHSQFRDVPREAYFYQPVDWAWKQSVAAGVTDELFVPSRAVTRAQAVTFLWRAAGRPAPRQASGFTDVPADAYYADAAAWAKERGVTTGTTPTTFKPGGAVTRAEMVTFLWRYEQSPEPATASSFVDVPTDAYYAKPVAWAKEQGITGGTTPTRFSPRSSVIRAQAVTFLWRASR